MEEIIGKEWSPKGSRGTMLNMLFRVEMSMCLLLESAWNRKSVCVLSRVGWFVLLLARGKRKEIEGVIHGLLCCSER